MPKTATPRDRYMYWLDNNFSRGPHSLIKWLGILSIVCITVIAAVLSLGRVPVNGEGSVSFIEAFWLCLMRTLDAGTMGDDVGWLFRITMFIVTLCGVFIISTFIGLLTNGIEHKIEELRKGRSRILEEDHTVILGWSEQVLVIISELVQANFNQPRSCIAVMSEHEKVFMEDEIRHKIPALGNTRVVCRRGFPMIAADLQIVNINTAKSIIVISPEDDNPDCEVIKTVHAILNHPGKRQEPYHIVAAIHSQCHTQAAHVVGKDEVEWIMVGDFVARVIAQTCLQSGLSVVVTDMLDFEGDEIYITKELDLVGKTYRHAIDCFPKNAIMGIKPAKMPAVVNPPMDHILRDDDELIVIAEDDDQIFYKPLEQSLIQSELISTDHRPPSIPESFLILGWNSRGPSMIEELGHYISPGSKITVLAYEESLPLRDTLSSTLPQSTTLEIKTGNSTDPNVLKNQQLDQCNHVLLLSYSGLYPQQKADAHTLLTLIHLRDIASKNNYEYTIVTEMMDIRNRDLAATTRADDFIVSERLISLVMAQISENKKLGSVLQDLFTPDGSEIYIKPIQEYVQIGVPVNFYTLLEAASRKKETAIGYRILADSKDPNKNYGVHINPLKHLEMEFALDDKLIVIAES